MKKNPNDLKRLVESKNLQKRIDSLAKKYKNKNVIIYGAGILSSLICENYDLSRLNIIGVADIGFYENEEKFYNYEAIPSLGIIEKKPDVILLATFESYKIMKFLKENIFNNTGAIPVESIIKKSFSEKITEFFDYCATY